MTATWVIGCNGLLGSALLRALRINGFSLYVPDGRFRWGDETELNRQLQLAVRAFAAFVGRDRNWHIYWAAGLGTMSSTEADLKPETRTISHLLNLIAAEPGLSPARGCIIFASSAGAIYADTFSEIISEKTPPSPVSAYANEKLKQENLVSKFVLENGGASALLARISTLYGTGQSTGKQQGLIAHLARSIIRNQHVHIYVPFDTIRDYIWVDDAASAMVATASVISGQSGVFTKIIAAEKPTTIAEIISIFKRISRRRPRIVSSSNKMSRIYRRRIRFHSTVLPISEYRLGTSLIIGIAQVMAAEQLVFAKPRARALQSDPIPLAIASTKNVK